MKNKKKIIFGSVLLLILNILILKSHFGKKTLLTMVVTDFFGIAALAGLQVFYQKLSERMKKFIHILLWLITAPFLFWIVQMVAVEGFTVSGKYLYYNFVMYLAIWIVFSFIFRKIKVAAIIYGLLGIVLAAADYYVNLFRGQPFMLIDLLSIQTAATVVSNYHFEVQLKLGAFLEIFWFFLMLQLLFQNMEYPKKWKYAAVRGIGTVVSLVTIIFTSMNLKNRNIIEPVDFWDTQAQYANKGLAYTLMSEGQYLSAEKPKDYSEERVEEVIAKVKEEKNNFDEESSPENIIVIMNESWSDLETIGAINSDTVFMPYIKSLREQFSNGYVHVPVFGAGTAETEYEVLTGNLKYFLPTGSVAYKLYVDDPEYGLAYTLKEQGYKTVAMHPYWPQNWNRETVFKEMRFDDFISWKNWGMHLETLRAFPSDASTYDRLLKLYEDKNQGEKLFTFCVTMQNHGGYDESTSGDFVSTVKLDYQNSYPLAETYLSEANITDQAFEKLVDYFENRDEKTMIVMFGDHLPAIETEFYEELYGKALSELDMYELQKRYMTPYIIWTNYPCERKVEEMSSNYLGSYILEQAGLKMSDFQKSLLRLKAIIPVIGQGAICDSEGKWYSLNETLPESCMTALDEYQLLQYNNIFDKTNLVSKIE